MSSVLPLLMTTKGSTVISGDLYGWGSNSVSQIGDDKGLAYMSPTASASAWKDIASSVSGGTGSNGIKTNGTLWAWGTDAQYCGINSSGTYVVFSPVQIGSDTNWSKCFKQVSGGFAIKTNGTLWTWGFNQNGCLGILGAPNPVISPVQVGTATNWRFVDSSGGGATAATAAIRTNGTLWTWGAATNGGLGNGTTTPDISSPVQVGALTNWAQVSVGTQFMLAIKTNGTLWGWGLNTSGQLGDGTAVSKSSPVQIGTLTNWAQISAGNGSSRAVRTDGTLWAWGSGASGQLGDGTTASKSSPVQIGSDTNWSQALASFSPSGFGLKNDGTLWSWGAGALFQLGDGTIVPRSSPVQIGSFGGVTTFKITYGWGQGAVYLLADTTLYGWGGNAQLGLGLNGISPSFTTSDVSQASFGVSHSCFVKSNGTLWANGFNNLGQIGQNSTSTLLYRVPVQVGALTDWAQVSCANDFSVAVKTNGTLWSWGLGTAGQLGDGSVVSKSSPVQVGALTDWAQVSAGTSFCTTVKTDGTLWSWGFNTSGQLGSGSTTNRSSPVQVGVLTNWSQTSAGNAFAAAVKTDGTLWLWGLGTSGQLGDGTAVSKSSPVQIGALTDWAQVSAGLNFAMAVKTDGTLWGWGLNASGQLGDGTTTNRSSPVQIGALTNWSRVVAGNGGSASAIKTDGSVWSWGSNAASNLGAGDQTILRVSSPVQIAASGYTSIATNSAGSTFGAIA